MAPCSRKQADGPKAKAKLQTKKPRPQKPCRVLQRHESADTNTPLMPLKTGEVIYIGCSEFGDEVMLVGKDGCFMEFLKPQNVAFDALKEKTGVSTFSIEYRVYDDDGEAMCDGYLRSAKFKRYNEPAAANKWLKGTVYK